MRRFLFLLALLAVMMNHLPFANAKDNASLESLLKEDTVAMSIRNILFSPRSTTQQQLDSIKVYVNTHPSSPYFGLRMAMLGGVLMRLTPNADVDRINDIYEFYHPYMEALPSKYFFYENWYFLVESYLFCGEEVKAAQLARQLYFQATKENDIQGKAFATYVLGMFYQMQNLNENALEYYRIALPLFRQNNNWDLFDVCGINTMDVMMEMGETDNIMPIFNTLDSLSNVTIANDMRHPLNLYNVLITKGISATYVYSNDKTKLKPYLDETRKLYSQYSNVVIDSVPLHTIERCYSRISGDLLTELKLTESIHNNMKRRGELANLGRETKSLADCYLKIGDLEKASLFYKEYITLQDSLNKIIKVSAINHVAAEYNLDRLGELNNQLEEEVSSTKKAVMWLLFGILMLVLITLVLAVYYYRQRASDLKRVSEMKSAFIQSITHEINTPLNAVMGFSEVIANMANDPEQITMAELVKVNSLRLSKIVSDTLYLSDYDSGTILNLELSMVNLVSLTNQIRDKVEEVEQCHYIDLSGDVFLEVKTHKDSLEVILYNLIHNAVLHGKPPVRVSYERNNKGKVLFHIKDEGEKIPDNVLNHIFDRFYKVNAFSTGMGVGLTVAKIAADRIGATIEYNKACEIGNEFIVTL